MNPGDHLRIHIWNAPVPGEKGQMALETSIDDLTTHKFGWMQASAKNGYMATNINDCSGTPFNYQPEYSSAGPLDIVPWAALQTNISTEFEIGHFEACTSLSQKMTLSEPGFTDSFWNKCHGPYENAGAPDSKTPEAGDALCYPKGDTHGGTAPPNIVTGCEDNWFQNGDLDFDGNGYWREWPNSTTPDSFPSTFLQSPPTTGNGAAYPKFQIQTDTALSESTCQFPNTSGCAVPPPTAPGKFYPYWTLTKSCVLEFGMMTNGNSFGMDRQYGKIHVKVGYPEFFGPIMSNPCAA
jgi:hypothetical protein